MKLIFSSLLFCLVTGNSLAAGETYYDRSALEAWLRSDLPRGRGFPVSNAFPNGNRIKFCAGAGCKIKIPFEFSEGQLREVAQVIELARREHCSEDSARCEREALRYGLRAMDKMVRSAKLSLMSYDEVIRNSVNRDNGNNPENFADRFNRGDQMLRDCVDQATNGSSYLVVLAGRGLLHHHRVVAPGQINLGIQPHFFTQLRELGGGKHLYRFDLYRTPRTDFEKLAGIEQRD